MASYKQFEDLPVWRAAIDLAADIFALTSHDSFKYRGDLVNQIRRSSLSVSNNIAEGFERGTTADLVNFLYIARGSCGETRSMLRFAIRLGGLEAEKPEIDRVADKCERVSRQLYGWLDALQNSDISGQKGFDDNRRRQYVIDQARALVDEEFSHEEQEKAVAEGRQGEFFARKMKAEFEARRAAERKIMGGGAEEAPKCPECGEAMVKRHDRNGRSFWGCRRYPSCRGTRPFSGNT